ncbi:DUF2061 domain-containing protein [Jiella sonneratiae]|uniref:DUF2061 domain-containing protein n=1 Tax=Jiella sonneratiae TaxID=2816856 RepID=A0ABS3J027_9HYPH|nr:DUF2061 domain-containing protein [Jiella sonneratiae]MBO0903029.1 DUF2061 domain-containing protein [Jiella sonneratiae]
METRKRSLAKAVSWQILGFAVMTFLGFLFTGSFETGGALALVSTLLGFASYLAHERIWAAVGWGRITGAAPVRAERRTGCSRPKGPEKTPSGTPEAGRCASAFAGWPPAFLRPLGSRAGR